jgi:hypothetical protein
MRLTLLPVIAVAAASAMSFAWVGVATWDNAKTGLLAALSVIAAATLVRLARGLPFTNPDHFEPDEVEKVVEAVKLLSRALRALLGVTLSVMVLVVLAAPLSAAVGRAAIQPWLIEGLQQGISAAVGGGLAFALARIWQVVGSDLGLLEKQGQFMIRAVGRKQRKADEEQEKQGDAHPFKTPSSYGQRVQ